MRVTVNLELKAEMDSFDLKQRKVLIKLMTEAARQIHTRAVLLSQQVSPKMKLTVSDLRGGTEVVTVFAEEKSNT